MNRILFALMLAISLIGCRRDEPVVKNGPISKPAAKQKREPANDEERLQGSWRATAKSEVNGRPTGINAIWEFTDKKAILQEGFGKLAKSIGTFTMNSHTMPKTLDLDMPDGQYACIYQFDGDQLSVCFDESGTRPKEFSSADNRTLFIFKRE